MTNHVPGVFINGESVRGTGQSYQLVTPWNGEPLASVSFSGRSDVIKAIASAESAFEQWSRMPTYVRAAALVNFASVLDEHAVELAELQVMENGKLFKEVVAQARQLGDHLRYYSSLLWMPRGYAVEPPIGGMTVVTDRVPIGVIAAITPWNSPLNLLMWKLGPALAAGNTVVVKPSEITPLSTLRLAELAIEAGIPPGVFNVVTGTAETGSLLIADRRIAKIAFTGSSAAGERIAMAAATGLRRLSLELGGKSANVVFDDADAEEALKGVGAGVFGASGQTCMAGSRVLVQSSIHESFLNRLVDFADRVRIGDPFAAESDMGSVATIDQLRKIEGMVSEAASAGAIVRAGGNRERPHGLGDGLFYRPTVLSDVTPDMTIFREEVFGPVACVLPFEDESHAIELANDSNFGLAAGVWTADLARAGRVASRLRAGTVWINNYRKVAFNVPFGGMKMSGIGRENGARCLDDYTEEKAIWTDVGLGVRDPFNPRA